MKINIIEVPESVANGQNKLMNDAAYLMFQIGMAENESHDSLEGRIQTFLQTNDYSVADILRGLYYLSLRYKYQGSQVVAENLENILSVPTLEEIKTILEQWKLGETAMYEVVPDAD